MGARRFLNLVWGLTLEGLEDEEREDFLAESDPAYNQTKKLASIAAIGGEIA